jgi:hypothetical protein
MTMTYDNYFPTDVEKNKPNQTQFMVRTGQNRGSFGKYRGSFGEYRCSFGE